MDNRTHSSVFCICEDSDDPGIMGQLHAHDKMMTTLRNAEHATHPSSIFLMRLVAQIIYSNDPNLVTVTEYTGNTIYEIGIQ